MQYTNLHPGNLATKSLSRKHQGHILLVLAKKYGFTKHLEKYDYPKELCKNCLTFNLAVDKTIDINRYYILNIAGVPYSEVFLDASGETRKGNLKLRLTDSLSRCPECPETVRKSWTQFRNV